MAEPQGGNKPLTTNNTNACLTFAKQIWLMTPQVFWGNILWTDESKVKLFERHGSCYIWCSLKRTQHSTKKKTVWLSGLFCCFKTWRTCYTLLTMISALHQKILKENGCLSVCEVWAQEHLDYAVGQWCNTLKMTQWLKKKRRFWRDLL